MRVCNPGPARVCAPHAPYTGQARVTKLSAPFHARSAAEPGNRSVTLGCNFPVWEAPGTTALSGAPGSGACARGSRSPLPPVGLGEPVRGPGREDTGSPVPEAAAHTPGHQPLPRLRGSVLVQHSDSAPPWPGPGPALAQAGAEVDRPLGKPAAARAPGGTQTCVHVTDGQGGSERQQGRRGGPGGLTSTRAQSPRKV